MDESTLDQFLEAEAVPEVDFDSYETVAFTDGSCIGSKTKSAGSGVYFHSKLQSLNQVKILEHMPKQEIIYMNLENEIIFCGEESDLTQICGAADCVNIGYAKNADEDTLYCSKHKIEASKVTATYVRYSPTNIRAEGNAILLALSVIANDFEGLTKLHSTQTAGTVITDIKLDRIKHSNKKILIVSDSKFWIDLVDSWLPNWVAKRQIMERKNIDLVVKILIAVNRLSALGISVEFLHVRGHQDEKKDHLSFAEKGNVIADKLATHASAMARYGKFITK